MTTNTVSLHYSHTQYAPLCLILYAVAVGCFTLVILTGGPMGISIGGTVSLVLAFLAASFHHLSVEDLGDDLEIRFGPIQLFRRTVKYCDISSAAVGRTMLVDGLGIHLSPRGGWVWNIGGRDCVVVHFKAGGTLRIGTDDPENLANFLLGKVQA